MSAHKISNLAAQGDVLFRRIRSIPRSAVREKTQGTITVAHSETGHHHTITSDGVTLFREPQNPLICYLQMEGIEHADVVHHRPFDTHETLRLLATPKKKTVFEVRRQREYTPQGWRRVED